MFPRKLFFFLFLFLCTVFMYAQVRLCSWNIQDFGRTKSDSEIVYMAGLLRDFDIVAVTEVVAGIGGAQAVAKLADALNRTGTAWDYTVSDPTSGSPHQRERYAYLWKKSKLKRTGDAWLEKQYHEEIEREPFFIEFSYGDKKFRVALMHAIPRSRQPETEIKYLKLIEERDAAATLFFCGDFNCPQSHTVFIPLKKRGYRPALTNCKTTLKQKKKNNECLASEFDNIFYNSGKLLFKASGAVHFYKTFATLAQAGKISDHLPVWMEFDLR